MINLDFYKTGDRTKQFWSDAMLKLASEDLKHSSFTTFKKNFFPKSLLSFQFYFEGLKLPEVVVIFNTSPVER